MGGPGVSVAGAGADAQAPGFLKGASAAAELSGKGGDGGVFVFGHFDEDAGGAQILRLLWWAADQLCR